MSETHMSVPLDSDSFLRRECPTCEREFKWFNLPEGEGVAPDVAGYYCPYCGIQAPTNTFLTKAQVELARNIIARELVGPELAKFGVELSRSQRSGSLVSFKFNSTLPPAMDPLVETNDMRRVDFACHPNEPVKVLDEWDREVHCLVCGSVAAED
jgi:ribosomal protein S27E